MRDRGGGGGETQGHDRRARKVAIGRTTLSHGPSCVDCLSETQGVKKLNTEPAINALTYISTRSVSLDRVVQLMLASFALSRLPFFPAINLSCQITLSCIG